MKNVTKIPLAMAIALATSSFSTFATNTVDEQLVNELNLIKSSPMTTTNTQLLSLYNLAKQPVSEAFESTLLSEIQKSQFNFPLVLSDGEAYQMALLSLYQRIFNLRPNQNAMPESVLDPAPAHSRKMSVPGSVSSSSPRLLTGKSLSIDHSHKQPNNRSAFKHYILPGLYVAPGENVTINVEVTGGSFDASGKKLATLKVNQHSDILVKKNTMLRSPAVSGSMSLVEGEHVISSAYGGLISIVPNYQGQDLTTKITISGGVIEAPVYDFSFNTENDFSLERNKKAPWGIMKAGHVQYVVTSYDLFNNNDLEHAQNNFITLGDNVEAALGLDGSHEALSPLIDEIHTASFVQDIQISAGSMHSGYPVKAGPGGNPLESIKNSVSWGPVHEIGHNLTNNGYSWKIGKVSTEVSNNIFPLMHADELIKTGEVAHYNRLVSQDGSRNAFIASYELIKQGASYEDAGSGFSHGTRLPMYRQLDLAHPNFWTKLNQEVALQQAGVHPNEKSGNNAIGIHNFILKYGSAVMGRSLVDFFNYWGVTIDQELAEQTNDLWPAPSTPIQYLFEDYSHHVYQFDPIAYEYEKQQRLETIEQLIRTFPIDKGWVNFDESSQGNYLTISINQTNKLLCRFNTVNELTLEVKQHLGWIENNTCTIGEFNRIDNIYNFNSDILQVIDLNTHDLGGQLMTTIANELRQVCYREDEPWVGIGTSNNGRKCSAEFKASNGRNWSFSRDNQMVVITPEQINDPIDETRFPDDQGWVDPQDAQLFLTVDTSLGQQIICRFSYNDNITLGFIENGTCSIGGNNSIDGIAGLSSQQYQVVDQALGLTKQAVQITLSDGEVAQLCYRPEEKWLGMGYSLNNKVCSTPLTNMKAANGRNWKFSRRNTFVYF